MPGPRTQGQTVPDACPVCDARECRVYLAGSESPAGGEELTRDSIGQNRLHCHPGTVLRCGRCGLGFRQARPDPLTLAGLYEDQDVDVYLSEASGRRSTARKHWQLVKPLMRRGHVLDIGSASGLFLEQVASAGWRASGIEPSRALCQRARERLGVRAELVCGPLETSRLPAESFDVVTLWDVLEHAPDPREFLRASAGPLKRGGYLLLNVPHLDSNVARLLGRRWPLLLPEHQSYFTRDSLRRCAAAAGLSCERFDHRLAFFSLGRVLQRLGEHEVPLAATLHRLLASLGAEKWVAPVPLGEIVAILRKPL